MLLFKSGQRTLRGLAGPKQANGAYPISWPDNPRKQVDRIQGTAPSAGSALVHYFQDLRSVIRVLGDYLEPGARSFACSVIIWDRALGHSRAR